jgi:cob(I)alamin adenosyltransferase
MSIATKTGDNGTTALMYGRRVAKNHPRVEAVGTVDELNAALGLARATADHDFVRDSLSAIQQDLVPLMGELAVAKEDLERYARDGFPRITPAMTAMLDALVTKMESQNISFKKWATPGGTRNSAELDMARTVCRRAERRVCDLQSADAPLNSEIIVFLNRLSDVLWLFARWVEAQRDR